MKYCITLDGGTTNTRTILWNHEFTECAHAERHIGIRDVATSQSKKVLFVAVKECIEEMLHNQKISYGEVSCILAAGMITSDLGLYLLEHVVAPVKKEDLAAGMKQVVLSEICPIPFWFIPGIKNMAGKIDENNFTQMDIMRGEEVEIISIMDQLQPGRECVVVLPGSHSKFIAIDKEHRIKGCMTSMTGELYALLVANSILSGATDKVYAGKANYNKAQCLKGYKTAKESSVGRAAFLTRILKNFAGISNVEATNYLLGVVLSNDISILENNTFFTGSSQMPLIVLSGKEPFRQGLYDILSSECPEREVEILEPKCENMSAKGCFLLARCRGII